MTSQMTEVDRQSSQRMHLSEYLLLPQRRLGVTGISRYTIPIDINFSTIWLQFQSNGKLKPPKLADVSFWGSLHLQSGKPVGLWNLAMTLIYVWHDRTWHKCLQAVKLSTCILTAIMHRLSWQKLISSCFCLNIKSKSYARQRMAWPAVDQVTTYDENSMWNKYNVWWF